VTWAVVGSREAGLGDEGLRSFGWSPRRECRRSTCPTGAECEMQKWTNGWCAVEPSCDATLARRCPPCARSNSPLVLSGAVDPTGACSRLCPSELQIGHDVE
jgi:hypothetical protein